MTTVLVTGASGVLGSSLLSRPAAAGYDLRATSRRPLRGSAAGIAWRRADLGSGEGLDAAVAGVDVVIHAASAPREDTWRTDVEGTARLLAAAGSAGVRHLVYVSIVGIDRVPLAYYRHKLTTEEVVSRGAVPWTILRGTQFHDLMDGLMRRMTRLPVALVPAGFKAQPIHVDEFADVLWRCAAAAPAGRAPDAAGPEVLSYPEMLRMWMAARGMRKPVLRFPLPGAFGRAMRRGDATAPRHAVGRLTWAEWVRARYAGPAGAAALISNGPDEKSVRLPAAESVRQPLGRD